MTASETAQIISRIWQEVLLVEEVGLHDHFYDLGGNPRLLEQMLHRLQTSLHMEISLIDLCQHPTVMSLARYYAGERKPASSVSASYKRARRQRRLMAQRYPMRLSFASSPM